MPTPRLQPQHTALLVIDVQEKLLPHMHNAAQVSTQVGRLIDGFKVLGLPILVTEQYRKGLGLTVPELAGRLPDLVRREGTAAGVAAHGSGTTGGPGAGSGAAPLVSVYEKLKFSACVEPVREELIRRGVRSLVVCGIEAHVCVLQTCLDLVDTGYVTLAAFDAIGSRRMSDQRVAEERLMLAGVVPTTVESALLELVHEAGGAAFKAILPLIK